jgi:hypothetical protein
MLYQAFLGTADNPNRSRNIEETRTSILVIDALAKVSDVVNTGQMNETRILKAEGGEVSLDEAAFKLLQRSVDAYVGQVQFAMAKSAMDMKDFVDAAAASK